MTPMIFVLDPRQTFLKARNVTNRRFSSQRVYCRFSRSAAREIYHGTQNPPCAPVTFSQLVIRSVLYIVPLVASWIAEFIAIGRSKII